MGSYDQALPVAIHIIASGSVSLHPPIGIGSFKIIIFHSNEMSSAIILLAQLSVYIFVVAGVNLLAFALSSVEL